MDEREAPRAKDALWRIPGAIDPKVSPRLGRQDWRRPSTFCDGMCVGILEDSWMYLDYIIDIKT